MKKMIIAIYLILSCSVANAGFMGYYGVNDTLSLPVFCVDSLGKDTPIDSVKVWVRYQGQGANASTYSATGGAGAAAAWIDSFQVLGRTDYYFFDVVGDVDAAQPNGMYIGDVMTLETTGSGWETHNKFSFLKVGDATASGDNLLDHFIVEVRPGVDMEAVSGDVAAADSVEYSFDGGVTTILEQVNANQTDLNTIITDVTGINGWAPTTDSTNVYVANTITTVTGNVNGSVGSVTNEVNIVSTDTITTVLGNVNGSVASVTGAVGSVTGAVGSVTGNVGGSVASVTGAVGSVTGNVGGNVTGSVGSNVELGPAEVKNVVWGQVADSAFANGSMGDSAKGWGATSAGGDDSPSGWDATDSLIVQGLVSDTITQHYPTNFADLSISATTGYTTSNLTSGGVESVWNKAFSFGFANGSMGDSLTNSSYVQGSASGLDSTAVLGAVTQFHQDSIPDVNVAQISGDTDAADSLEEMADGYDNTALTIYEMVDANRADVQSLNGWDPTSETTYPEHIYKMVVNGSPTTTTFRVSYISPTATFANDWFNGIQIMATTGNATKQIVKVADFTVADSTFTVRPGFTTAYVSGDTVLVLPTRGGIESSVLTNDAIAVDGSGHVTTGAIGVNVITAASIADNALDSATFVDAYWNAHQKIAGDSSSAGGGLDTLSTTFATALVDLFWGEDSTGYSGIDMAYLASQTGSSSSPWTSAEADSVLDALFLERTLDAIDTNKAVDAAVKVMNRLGQFSDTGSVSLNVNLVTYLVNTIFDYIDSINTNVIDFTGGDGNRICSLYVWDGSNALTSGSTRMTSGATSYTASINGAGFAIYNLTDATWTGLVYAPGYSQDTIPQTFVITASVKDTFNMTAYSITSPTLPEQVTCWADVWDIYGDTVDNAILEARVYKQGPYFDSDGDPVLIPDNISAGVTDSGRVEIILLESAEATNRRGDSLKYIFRIISPGRSDVVSRVLIAPDSVTWKIDWSDQ